jgi:hypothetical protein
LEHAADEDQAEQRSKAQEEGNGKLLEDLPMYLSESEHVPSAGDIFLLAQVVFVKAFEELSIQWTKIKSHRGLVNEFAKRLAITQAARYPVYRLTV